jgi:hypothetical protein
LVIADVIGRHCAFAHWQVIIHEHSILDPFAVSRAYRAWGWRGNTKMHDSAS